MSYAAFLAVQIMLESIRRQNELDDDARAVKSCRAALGGSLYVTAPGAPPLSPQFLAQRRFPGQKA